MNKKFLSFVLAAVLAISLGSSSAFARVDFGQAGAGIDTDDQGVVMTINYDTDMKKFAEQKQGDLVTFFGYAAGTMTYAASKTSISFYDAYGMKVGYSVTANDSFDKNKPESSTNQKYNYTLTSLSLNANDYQIIQSKYGGDLKKYLTEGLNVNPKALQTVKTDSKGNIVKDSNGDEVMVDAAWLSDASKWLEGGVNFSATISLGGSEPTVTLSENGKANATLGSYAGKSYVATHYTYNDAGFLTQTENVELVETSGSDNQAQYKKQYSVTVMNSKGQQSYTYKANDKWEAINYTKKEMKVSDDGKVSYEDKKDSSGKVVEGSGHTVDFHYSANGSMTSYTDHTTGNTTHFVGGKTSYVTNAEGSIVSQYKYENGIMKTAQSFNNGTVVNTTVFDSFGRMLGTVNGNVSYEKAVNAIKSVRETGIVTKDCIVQSYNVYNDMNAKLVSNSGHTYGYSTAIADVSVTQGDDEQQNVQLAGNKFFIKGDDGKWRLMTDAELKKYTTTTTSYSGQKTRVLNAEGRKLGDKARKITISNKDGIACMSESDAKFLCEVAGIDYNTYKRNLKDIKIGDSYKYGKSSLVTLYVEDSSIADKIYAAFGIEGSGTRNKAGANDGSTIYSYCLGNSYTINTHKSATLTVTNYAQGVRIKQETKDAVNDSSKKTMVSYNYMDPAVVGTVNRIETINGKQYAVLTDAQVDIADGNGFQSADGEEMYVCIDDLSDEEKAQLQPGKTFAAAGYIDTSADGHYAINNLYAHEISSSDVQNMVQSFATTLAGNAEYQANVQMNMATFAKAAADGKTYEDWKGGWQLLVEYGGGAPALF